MPPPQHPKSHRHADSATVSHHATPPTITLSPDWRAAMRRAGKAAPAGRCQGETLNFESPGAFFGRLTERLWSLVTALQGQGAMAVRELARRASRDVKRVHEDVQVLRYWPHWDWLNAMMLVA